MLKPLQTKNSKKKKTYFQILIPVLGVLVSAIMFPAQSAIIGSIPTPTHTEISFTLPEGHYDYGTVLSGTSFGARDSDGDIIYYGLRFKDRILSISNKNTTRTTGTQYAEITYDGGTLDYEAVSEFDDGGRGYEDTIVVCDLIIYTCAKVSLRLYVTDVPEVSTMSGNIRVSGSMFVGGTVTADFTDIRDQEGVNSPSMAWSRAVCPDDRGVGRWSVRQRISSADDSHSYQLTNSDISISNRVKSVWGQYQTDTDHYKWVCKDIDYGSNNVIQPEPEPENTAPRVGHSPGHYNVNENSGSGTLSADSSGQTPRMYDLDQETITYSISVPEDTPSDIARFIRSTFRVRNTAPNPTTDSSAQPISISYNRSFNYETTPDLDDGRGYDFDIKGCDLYGACETLEIRVYVDDVAELGTVSNLPTMVVNAGQVINSHGFYAVQVYNIKVRRGLCPSSRGGHGTFPTDASHVDVAEGLPYVVQQADIALSLSVWVNYSTPASPNTTADKWGCRSVEVNRHVVLQSISGRSVAGGTVSIDFSNITDMEGVNNLDVQWRRGRCTSSKGMGDLPAADGSGAAYVSLQQASLSSYTLQAADVGLIVSAWGSYETDTGNKKWVCLQTRTISGDPALSTVSVRVSGRNRVPAKKHAEFILTRTNGNLSSALIVQMENEETWEENGEAKIFRSKYSYTIPANETQITFTRSINYERTLKMTVTPNLTYLSNVSPATVIFTVANSSPSGNVTITGTVQAGQTLTADVSGITDGNNGDKDEDGTSGDILSSSFSYTWSKIIDFGPNAGIPQQISGATSSTYTIKQEDIRAKIKVKVSYRDDDGYDHALESAFTAKVKSVTGAKPSVVGIALKNDPNQDFINSDSSFEASVGDLISVIVYMSEEVEDLSILNGDVRMRLNIGSQTRTLFRVSFQTCFGCDETPNRLVFHYTVEEGVSGRITVPSNGMFVEGANTGVVSNPSNINLNYPQTYLANMRVQSSLNISILDAIAYENTDRYIDFPVRLNRNATETTTVDWATSNGTAMAGSDYIAGSGTLTFNPGDGTSFNPGDRINLIRVFIIDDDIEEGRETFQVTLSNLNPSSVQLADATATGTITNSDADNDDPETEEPPPLPPITASFIDMPSEHNGSDTFTFELRFSENIKGFSYKTLKNNGAFQVTNGSIKNASRLVKRLSQRWEIVVQPNSNSDVTITLPETQNCSAAGAVCAKDGRKLTNSTSARVLGPVGISVADASADENTDSTIDFTVSLSRSSTSTITVNYTTENGTATAGQDYTSKSGTLTFAAGETSKTVSVSLLSDVIDEGNETFKLKLSSPTGNAFLKDDEATGTIENSDPMPKAWLARFGRTVGSQAVDAISSRMGAPTENRVVVGGVEMSMAEETEGKNLQNIHQQFESSRGNWDGQRNEKNQTMTLEELIHGTSFSLSGEDEDTGRTWSAWGQFASDNFKGEEGDLNLEGKVNTGFLGADLASGNWRGGMAVSTSEGEGSFHSLKSDSVGDKGEVESSLTSIYPYFGYEFDENKAIWGILGIGEGDVTLTQENLSTKADISMRMGAVGAKGPLLSQNEGDGMDVILQTDVMWVQMDSEKTREMMSSESDVTRFRLTLDSSTDFNIGEEGVLTPSFQMGVRHDAGDAEEGMGLEAGGAVRYAVGALTLEGSLRKLVAHEESGHEEWGASAALRVDPGQSGRGLSLSVLPTWGEPSSGVSNLLSVEGPRQLGSDDFKAENRLEAEIGYGVSNPFKKLLGVLTPYFALSLGDTNRVTRTGTRWKISHNANLGLELSRTKGESKESDDKAIMLRGGFQW